VTASKPRLRLDGPQARWQEDLREAFRDGRALLEYLQLKATAVPASPAAQEDFSCLVPKPFAQRMRKGDPRDPLLLQVLPSAPELARPTGYHVDPLGEGLANQGDGVLKKYPGRALLIATGACPVHCRYCFRRHFPYQEHQAANHDWQDALNRIQALDPIEEVILSGGDPLTLSNRRLGAGIQALDRLPRLRTIRLHTRFPVMIPSRVDTGLTNLLKHTRARVVIVIHANHANELDASVARGLEALREAGVTLLNQSVLLRGVNDSTDALTQLSESLFAAGVLPYYLHLLDPVAGAAHFKVSATTGVELIRALRARLPGYLVPRLARETPGDSSKSVLA
jgi:EF-P beta-lysylation protein EpmB